MDETLTRRSFLQLGVGTVAISVLPVGGWSQMRDQAGQKVFARDFSAADMGWAAMARTFRPRAHNQASL